MFIRGVTGGGALGASPACHTLAKDMSLNRGTTHSTLGLRSCIIHPSYCKNTSAPLSKLPSCVPDDHHRTRSAFLRSGSISFTFLFSYYVLPHETVILIASMSHITIFFRTLLSPLITFSHSLYERHHRSRD